MEEQEMKVAIESLQGIIQKHRDRTQNPEQWKTDNKARSDIQGALYDQTSLLLTDDYDSHILGHEYFDPEKKITVTPSLVEQMRDEFEDLKHDALVIALELRTWNKKESETGIRFFDRKKSKASSINAAFKIWIRTKKSGGRLGGKILQRILISFQEISGNTPINEDGNIELVDLIPSPSEQIASVWLEIWSKIKAHKPELKYCHPIKYPHCNALIILETLIKDLSLDSDKRKYFHGSGSVNRDTLAERLDVPYGIFSSWYRDKFIPLLKELGSHRESLRLYCPIGYSFCNSLAVLELLLKDLSLDPIERRFFDENGSVKQETLAANFNVPHDVFCDWYKGSFKASVKKLKDYKSRLKVYSLENYSHCNALVVLKLVLKYIFKCPSKEEKKEIIESSNNESIAEVIDVPIDVFQSWYREQFIPLIKEIGGK